MKVDIWSDIRCPFCYIGKRHFESALAGFLHRDMVRIEWHSFELDPFMKTEPGVSIHDYLARLKQISREQSVEMHERVTQMAAAAGLHYDFDRVVVANSFDAHRLIQLAKSFGKADTAEERLFSAHFTEGKDISDFSVLSQLGFEIGLDSAQVPEVLQSGQFADEVRYDQRQAADIGIRGVPFFLFEDKYAVSGAQPVSVFQQAFDKVVNYLSA